MHAHYPRLLLLQHFFVLLLAGVDPNSLFVGLPGDAKGIQASTVTGSGLCGDLRAATVVQVWEQKEKPAASVSRTVASASGYSFFWGYVQACGGGHQAMAHGQATDERQRQIDERVGLLNPEVKFDTKMFLNSEVL